jgi:hypothetical protein
MPRKIRGNGNHSDPDGDYDVGYGRAPEQTRFKPGVSGNPKGRPRRDRDRQLNDMLEKELYRPIRIKQNNLTSSIPALQASMRNLMMSAAKGDPAAVMAALKIAGNLEQDREAKVTKNPPLTAEERYQGVMEIVNRAHARHARKLDAAKSKQPGQKSASQNPAEVRFPNRYRRTPSSNGT